MKTVKHELGPAGRDLNFNAYADNRSLFRYDMHTLPSEITQESSIGTSTLLAAWNASDNDAAAQARRRPESLRGYSFVSVRAAQRTGSANP